MHTHSLGEYMDFITRDDWRGVADLMLSSAEKLGRSGADFLICPDNTVHRSFALVAERSSLPWLHIVEEVAAEARRRGFRELAITGTSYTMEGPVYPRCSRGTGSASAFPFPGSAARSTDHLRGARERHHQAGVRVALRAVIGRMRSEGCGRRRPRLYRTSASRHAGGFAITRVGLTRLLARAALRRAIQGEA